MRRQQFGGGTRLRRLTAAGASAVLLGGLGAYGASQLAASASPVTATDQSSSCQLGNGIKHVVQIGFDNTHFFRDNPNVPSDLELMPNLLKFIEGNGVMLSNNHTPLIAHTSEDLLTTATGLYGDRQGVGLGNNGFRTYNPNGTTDPTTAFTYWTDPIDDTASKPTVGHDTNPNMVYSAVPPATAASPVSPTTVAPAPWVPYTRAGCNVGEVATANQELENPKFDIPKVFGTGSPEVAQLNADSDFFKDAETADYVGLGIHCAKGSSLCADAQAVKFGQTTASNTAVADSLPNEPNGYDGFQALFGARYIDPVIGAGTANVSSDGVPVTNAAGNITDEFGNEIDGAFLNNYPGFPGYGGINAAQSLSYAADMLENGVQVVNVYMADIHGNQGLPNSPQVPNMGTDCASAPDALPSGTQCYLDQAAYYNDAFGLFFQRLAADGITPQNTLFVVSSDEGDHEVGANVGRALQPTPAGCDGVKTLCNYPAGSFGELSGNLPGLLAQESGITTPFTFVQDSSPELFLAGNPGPADTTVRAFEHGVASLTADDPYTDNASQPLTLDLANPVEEAVLHMTDADPARTATLAMFANPDYFLTSGKTTCNPSGLGGCVSQTTGFAYDHGDYAAEINTNYVGLVGPGVQNLGLDGPAANAGATSSGPDSGLITVADTNFPGPWVDETDIRPTILYLTGLTDDYQTDGRVITQILANPNSALAAPAVTTLGECYKQLNSSVGQFGASTLAASTQAIESTSSGDHVFTSIDSKLGTLELTRDQLAAQIKAELSAAAVSNTPVPGAGGQTVACQALINQANQLASSS